MEFLAQGSLCKFRCDFTSLGKRDSTLVRSDLERLTCDRHASENSESCAELMTTVEIELLAPLWRGPSVRPTLVDPWDRPCDLFGQERAANASIKDRPDFGWAFAERLVRAGRSCSLLKRPEYRWVRATVQFLTGGECASRRLRDGVVVSQAREIHDSDLMRPIINAALMTRDATVGSVAAALNLDSSLVDAYECLFFNILDRRSDLGYVRKLMGAGESSPLMISRQTTPSDEDVFLSVGFHGSMEDVLKHAGCIGGAGDESVEGLTDRLLGSLLAAGADWVGSPTASRQPPPALVTHAIDFAKKMKVEPKQETPFDPGMSIGSMLSKQLEMDADHIRRGVDQSVSDGLPN